MACFLLFYFMPTLGGCRHVFLRLYAVYNTALVMQ